jgi:hypothetical protein
LRRSLVLWGWGQVAAGHRRWLIAPIVQAAVLALLATLAPRAAEGTNASFVFAFSAVIVALWFGIPVHAHRVAARRRAAFDLEPGRGSGIDLLWLAPVVVVLSTWFWTTAGRLGDPAVVLSDYLADWRAGRSEIASARFEAPPSSPQVADAWERQLGSLRNALVRLAAVNGPDSGIDPNRPLDTIRWTTRSAVGPGVFLVDIDVARRVTARTQLFGLLPSTSQQLVTLEQLGTVELHLVDLPGQFGGQAWRIVRVEVGGVELRSGGIAR